MSYTASEIQSSPAGTLDIPLTFPPLKRRATIIRPGLRDCANNSMPIRSIADITCAPINKA